MRFYWKESGPKIASEKIKKEQNSNEERPDRRSNGAIKREDLRDGSDGRTRPKEELQQVERIQCHRACAFLGTETPIISSVGFLLLRLDRSRSRSQSRSQALSRSWWSWSFFTPRSHNPVDLCNSTEPSSSTKSSESKSRKPKNHQEISTKSMQESMELELDLNPNESIKEHEEMEKTLDLGWREKTIERNGERKQNDGKRKH